MPSARLVVINVEKVVKMLVMCKKHGAL